MASDTGAGAEDRENGKDKGRNAVGAGADTNGADTGLKWRVLAFLVVQNSSASLTMRYSKSRPGAEPWNSQTAVLMQEVLKASICATLLAREGSLRSVFSSRAEALKTAVPAVLYLCQNNLQYVAITYLDASTYAVMYQLKILTTALLSMLVLGKKLSVAQCISLVLLTIGVSTVVVSQISGRNSSARPQSEVFRGVAAVLMSCVSSGLAGVSFEKLLKGSSVSLWARNFHLALYSSVVGFAGLWWSDSSFSLQNDFFKGYSAPVWVAIINNALGGLLIAVVIKYADNILKNFSTSLSIILTSTVSVVFFATPINIEFLIGTSLVLYAVFLYGGMGIPMMLQSGCGIASAKSAMLHLVGCRSELDVELVSKNGGGSDDEVAVDTPASARRKAAALRSPSGRRSR